jgi:hypothetical protein
MKDVPLCEKCIYYKSGRYVKTGMCTRYVAYRGRGKLVYEFSDTVRLDRSRCGPDGKLFASTLPEQKKRETLLSLFNDDE